jgi:hypothetical protein
MKTKGFFYGVMIGALVMAAAFLPACATGVSEQVGSSIYIDAPPGEVYDWLINPDNQAKRLPEQTLTDVRGGKDYSAYHFRLQYMDRAYEGEEGMVGVAPGRMIVEVCTGDMVTCSVTYMMAPEGDGTRLIRVSQYSADFPLKARMNRKKVSEDFQEGDDLSLQLIKAEIEK